MERRYYHVNIDEFWRMWVSGVDASDIAARFAITKNAVYHIKRIYKMPDRVPVRSDNVPDPTPEEIRARKREVRRKHFAARRSEA
jgi:hypothetical protein